jgi:hypothetical protein
MLTRPITLERPQTGIDTDWVRRTLLSVPPRSHRAGDQTFHGIRACTADCLEHLGHAFARTFPELCLSMAFGRESPLGQAEPNDIHSDVGMGDATAILYLTPDPPADDGTIFWERLATGQQRGAWDAETQAAHADRSQWGEWYRARAGYGRLLVFPSDYYHSRAIPDNYGAGRSARLILVCFFRLIPGALETLGDG